MKKINQSVLSLAAIFLLASSVNATEVVYSSKGLENCAVVGEYKKSMRSRASKEKMEKRLRKMGADDNATHVFVTKFVDNTRDGKGIKATAIGKKCD